MPSLTACILSYNRANYLREAVDSILNQSIKPTEIIIFDNCSNADVYDSISTYLNRGVIWFGANKNLSATWNFRRAISSAKTEYLFVLHDDDRLCSNFVEEQMDFMLRHPGIGAVTCNGYLINGLGNRTGKLIINDQLNNSVKFYRSPAAVAIQYASNSCLPFSPAVYRTEFARNCNLQDNFGKVVDAVYFSDLARSGTIAYQNEPLYECRVHDAQDSSYFDTVELDKLSEYFEKEALGSTTERKELIKLLIRQHTSRQLIKLCRAIYPNPSLLDVLSALAGLVHRRFSFLSAASICAAAARKWLNGRIFRRREYRTQPTSLSINQNSNNINFRA
jgi:glycosyltransferase involved in cell wall biosynthesis